MVAIPAVRAALAAQVTAQIPGLRNAPTVPGQISPPMAVVRPARGTVVDYQETFDGGMTIFMEIVILVAMGNDRTGQTNLDGYLQPTGATSVFAAVQKDPTLGGVVADAHVTHAQGYGLIDYAGVEYIGSTLIVEVMAP